MARDEFGKLLSSMQDALLNRPTYLLEMLKTLLQSVIAEEFERYVQARRHERTESRRAYRNGSYCRSLTTRVGRLLLQIPRDREGEFRTEVFARFQRSEQALQLALLEMYLQGISTRKVGRVAEALFGEAVSKDVVSDLVARLDPILQAWRQRPVQAYYPYLYVDGTYYKVRCDGRVVSMVALLVLGVDADGRRELLSVAVAPQESEAEYGALFQALKARGLAQVDLCIGDDHAGLKAALAREFPRSAKQRCWVHVIRNLIQRCPARHRAETRARLKFALEAPTRDQALAELRRAVEWVATFSPELADWLDELTFELTAHMEFPRHHWHKIRSNNMLERVNGELRKRVRVLRIFPNAASCLRLVTALAMEQDDGWKVDARYVGMKHQYQSDTKAGREAA